MMRRIQSRASRLAASLTAVGDAAEDDGFGLAAEFNELLLGADAGQRPVEHVALDITLQRGAGDVVHAVVA